MLLRLLRPGNPSARAFHQTRWVLLYLIQMMRPATRSTLEPVSRTARVIPRPAWVSTSRSTAAAAGRWSQAAQRETRPARPICSFTCPVATGRSIGAIAIDPANANHIFIGTDVARHGSLQSTAVASRRRARAQIGLYESTDGGATFSPAVILTQDAVEPSNPTGGDFFRGGCSDIELYRAASETQVYASFFDYGVFRRSMTQDGDTAFHQIFLSAGGGTVANSSASRTEFSLAPNGAEPSHLRRRRRQRAGGFLYGSTTPM